MKTVRIQGGLGNQLFGFAFAHSLRKVTREIVKLDIGGYHYDYYGRQFELDSLIAECTSLEKVNRRLLNTRLAMAAARVLAGFVVSEGPPPKTEVGLTNLFGEGSYFLGYWQSERYILCPEEVCSKIRQFIASKSGPVDSHEVVIHFRSYNEELTESRRAAPSAEYFSSALRALAGTEPIRKIIVVSDDTVQARRILEPHVPNLDVLETRNHYIDFATIMSARRLILSNSSFSWWAGYCSQARDIIYPIRGDQFHYPAPAQKFICR
jgi:hypothetical protein